MKNGLLIPADPSKPVRLVDIEIGTKPEYQNLQDLVGGYIECQAHVEGDLWCNEEGRVNGSSMNVRVAHWQLYASEAGQARRIFESQLVFGDVVMTGPVDDEGDTTPITQTMVSYFRTLHLDADAMRDWDVRSTEVHVTDWEGREL